MAWKNKKAYKKLIKMVKDEGMGYEVSESTSIVIIQNRFVNNSKVFSIAEIKRTQTKLSTSFEIDLKEEYKNNILEFLNHTNEVSEIKVYLGGTIKNLIIVDLINTDPDLINLDFAIMLNLTAKMHKAINMILEGKTVEDVCKEIDVTRV